MASDTPVDTPILPAHIEDPVQSIARLHAEHYQQATRLQQTVDRMTALAGRPAVGRRRRGLRRDGQPGLAADLRADRQCCGARGGSAASGDGPGRASEARSRQAAGHGLRGFRVHAGEGARRLPQCRQRRGFLAASSGPHVQRLGDPLRRRALCAAGGAGPARAGPTRLQSLPPALQETFTTRPVTSPLLGTLPRYRQGQGPGVAPIPQCPPRSPAGLAEFRAAPP